MRFIEKNVTLESVLTNFVHLFNFFAAHLSGKVLESFSVWKVVIPNVFIPVLEADVGQRNGQSSRYCGLV